VPLEQTKSVLARTGKLLPPWDSLLLPVSAFPIPQAELLVLASVVDNIVREAIKKLHVSPQVFLQVEQSDDPEFRNLYARKAAKWMPELGLGIWPDREPPVCWSEEEFKKLNPGEKLRAPLHQILWISGPLEVRAEASFAMLPFGPLLQIMTADDGETFLEKATALLLPPLTDRTFTCYPFYVPLLEFRSLAPATPRELETWLCGASLYVRESFEDNGILIVSRESLTPVLEELGGRLEASAEPVWRISR
jgi:hypothetical protein